MKKEVLDNLIDRAEILIEAMPYIKQFKGETFVIKYGGNAMIDDNLKNSVIQDIVLLKYVGINPVVVHGGGPEISKLMEKLGIESKFVGGHRVTDSATLDVAEMVLVGKLNSEITLRINQAGSKAVGLSGKDAGLIHARKYTPINAQSGEATDIGFVGEVDHFHSEILTVLLNNDIIPVISPIAACETGQTYNINADLVAASLSAELKASKLILLTDVRGILKVKGDESTLVSSIKISEVEQMKKEGIISGGMIPKTDASVDALNKGVGKVHIIDGRMPHSILLETFTDYGIGTQIVKD